MAHKGGVRGGNEGREVGISEKELGIFGLTAIESKIVLCLLENGLTSVNKISRVTNIPHTSVHSALRRLGDQGLVRRVSKGYASIWEVVGLEKIRPKISKALKPFGSTLSTVDLDGYVDTNVSDRADFQVFRKTEPILRVIQWFFLNHRGKNVCEIQGINTLKHMIKKLGGETMAQLNDFMVTSQIHTDLIITQSSIEVSSKYVSTDLRLASSLKNRSITAYIAPDECFEQGIQTMVASDVAVIINWEEARLELIKDTNILKLLIGLFECAKKNGQFFDYSTYIQHLIEERRKA